MTERKVDYDQHKRKQDRFKLALNKLIDDKNKYQKGVQGGCKHKNGIPFLPNVLVRPTGCELKNGSSTVMITATEIRRFVVPAPVEKNSWIEVYCKQYTSEEDLFSLLDEQVFGAYAPFWERHIEEKDDSEQETTLSPE